MVGALTWVYDHNLPPTDTGVEWWGVAVVPWGCKVVVVVVVMRRTGWVHVVVAVVGFGVGSWNTHQGNFSVIQHL